MSPSPIADVSTITATKASRTFLSPRYTTSVHRHLPRQLPLSPFALSPSPPYRDSITRAFSTLSLTRTPSMDSVFVNALVRAGLCSSHSRPSGCLAAPNTSKSRSHEWISSRHQSPRRYHNTAAQLSLPESEEYQSVHHASESMSKESSEEPIVAKDSRRLLKRRRAARKEEPTFSFWSPELPWLKKKLPPRQINKTRPPGKSWLPRLVKAKKYPGQTKILYVNGGRFRPEVRFEGHEQELQTLKVFRAALQDPDSDTVQIYEMYRKLPSPRLNYIGRWEMETFVRRLMRVPVGCQDSLLRYLSLLDDMRTCKIPIRRVEWNVATYLVARSFRDISTSEIRSTFRMWRESEKAGVMADITTFNIVLDMAVRSKAPHLPRLVLAEMQTRGIKIDRFTYTVLIRYYGNRFDLAGVHKVFRDFVAAGEVVDTYFLNAFMSALINCDAINAAERIYNRMRDATIASLAEGGTTLLPNSLQREPEPGLSSTRTAINFDSTPDFVTFNLFLTTYCRQGDWERTEAVIGDMRQLNAPLEESTYILIFKGFCFRGKNTQWTAERLDSILSEMVEKRSTLEFSRPLVVWAVRATSTVYSNKDVVTAVWEVVETIWREQGGNTEGMTLDDVTGWEVEP